MDYINYFNTLLLLIMIISSNLKADLQVPEWGKAMANIPSTPCLVGAGKVFRNYIFLSSLSPLKYICIIDLLQEQIHTVALVFS